MYSKRLIKRHPKVLVSFASLCLMITGVLYAVPSQAASTYAFPSSDTPFTQAAAAKIIEQALGAMPKAGGATTRGIKGHTVTIAGVSDETSNGVPAGDYGECAGAQARIAQANRQGGVDGYKFKYAGCADSESNATTAREDALNAIDVQHAFALVPMGSNEVSGTLLNNAHEPYFGSGYDGACSGYQSLLYGFDPFPPGCTLAPKYPSESTLSDEALTVVTSGLKIAPSSVKWAFIGYDYSGLQIVLNDFASIITANHLGTVAYNQDSIPAPGSPPITDWTPLALQIINSGANVVLDTYTAGSDTFGLLQGLESNGYTGKLVISNGGDVTGASDLASASDAAILNGVYVEQPWYSSSFFPNSGYDIVAKDLKAIGSSINPNQLGVAQGWSSADMFIDAFAKAAKEPGKMTTQKLVNVINSGWTYPGLKDAFSPIVFPGGRLSQNNYVAMVQIKNDKVVPAASAALYGDDFFEKSS